MSIRIWRLAAAATMALAGCGDDGKPPTGLPIIATIEISPASASIELGRVSRLTAIARTASGEVVAGTVFSWSSENTAVATVESDGTVTSVSIGTTEVTATAAGKSNSATVAIVAPTSPAARWLAGMAYDDAQHRVLMFGGFGSSGASLRPLNDLWAWDGQQWSFLGAGGPGARGDMLAAWDGVRNRLVVYGGANNDESLGDTWEWDGSDWTQHATSGPTIRRHFGGGFHEARGRVVLFGGLIGETPAADTWEWDGQQWAQRATSTPGGFTAPSREMAYGLTRQALLMLVGSFSSGPSAVWQWNGSAWTSVGSGPTAAMPVPLAASGADEITMLLSGGSTVRWRSDVLTTVASSGPSAIDGASLAFDRSRDQLVLFGGLTSQGTLSDTWIWDGSAWTRITVP
jgi:hypothetical protein